MTFYFKRSKRTGTQKPNSLSYTLLTIFLMIAISPLACTPRVATTVSAPGTATETLFVPTEMELASSLTFVAEADAQVNENDPDQNAGTSSFLQVDGASDPEVESFLRFTVTGISGPIGNARLRVYGTTNASEDGPAIYATDTSWEEGSITWSNRPSRISEQLDNQGPIGTDAWVEYDVTEAVNGNGTFSFVLAADTSDAATFSSREGSQPPELVLTPGDGSRPTVEAATSTVAVSSETATTVAPAPGGPLLLIAEADARVRQARPGSNYGSDVTLHADGAGDSEIESFLRFTVSGIAGPIQEARLRIYVTDNGTQDGPAVYVTDNSWDESSITWSNRPGRIGEALDNKDRLGSNSWVEYNVTAAVTGSGTFNFVLVADSSDGVVFSSREGDQPPQLALRLDGSNASTAEPPVEPTVLPTLMPTGSSDAPILVGAGDIAECDNDNDELTAQLLDAIPGTVFTTGDNAYERGTITEYNNCYEPTWGRHKDRTKPVPGNHEYNTTNAAGYFEYFTGIPEYYAYDLGSWRIYALNSEIDMSETSRQVEWLRADLAANPRQCVLAYWHQPRWSSGSHHGNDRDYQTVWQIFYEAGAELVINGHEHHYERFAEMNAQGEISSPGLREIVVGTGGRNLYDFESPLPASEVRDDSTYGVLKLTLHPDRYDWQFIPVPGSTFTDSGSTGCH